MDVQTERQTDRLKTHILLAGQSKIFVTDNVTDKPCLFIILLRNVIQRKSRSNKGHERKSQGHRTATKENPKVMGKYTKKKFKVKENLMLNHGGMLNSIKS